MNKSFQICINSELERFKHLHVLVVYNSTIIPDNEIKFLRSFKTVCGKVSLLFTEPVKVNHVSILQRVFSKLKLPIDKFSINQRIISYVKSQKPDVLFLIKGTLIFPSTLKLMKKLGVKTVSWSNDDMYAWHNRTLYYQVGLKYVDLVVTQKSYNCNPSELPRLGAKRILFQHKSYDPFLHFPCENKNIQKTIEVLFIGSEETERAAMLKFLAENNIKMTIFGWGKNTTLNHENITVHETHLYDEAFRYAISESKICLNFLRKKNRDLQTSRSFEIPACGGFMLAERTREHLQLFEEKVDADFFSSKEELLEKIQFYLTHDEIRSRIAQNGFQRCKKDGYSFTHRLNSIFETLELARPTIEN